MADIELNDDERVIILAAIGAVMEPLHYLNDDDEGLMDVIAAIQENGLEERELTPRVDGFVERVVTSFSAAEFKNHFRMSPDTYDFLLCRIAAKLIRSGPFGNHMISPEKQLLITLWRLATPDSYRSINQRFGVGKATAVRCVLRVVRALTDLRHKFIKWPDANRAEEIARGFARANGFPGVIGAIDGTHINIVAPKVNPEGYVNRKGHHSMHLQAVCDHMGLFTHCFVGHAGSVHDARVFRLSSVSGYVDDPDKFPGDSHLLGDAAYPLKMRLLTPYPNNGHLSRRQKNYNFCHSSARMAIERAFGLLKGRWRCLLNKLEMRDLHRIPYHVMACCVLHNICLLRRDLLMAMAVQLENNVGGGAPAGGQDRALAEGKRNNIANNLALINE